MLEVDEALDVILKASEVSIEKEQVRIEEALYRVLAEDVLSSDDVPSFDASIKDGYAVRVDDGDGPRKVRTALGAGDLVSLIVTQLEES